MTSPIKKLVSIVRIRGKATKRTYVSFSGVIIMTIEDCHGNEIIKNVRF